MSELERNIHPPQVEHDEEIHLLDLLAIIARHRWLVATAPVLCGALALGASFLITPVFSSTAKIMPPQQQQSSGVAAMLGQLGGLAGAAGGIAGIKSPNDLYVGLMESRTVSDNLIKRFKLTDRYDATMEGTRKKLSANTEFMSGKKDGMISITTEDTDPLFAADLANAYIDELMKLTQTLALTEASQRRLFFEKQLGDVRDQLANAEIGLRETQEKTGMIMPDGQVQAILNNAAQLKSTIAAKEVELNSMRTYAAPQNPQLLRGEQELRALQGQLGKLEKTQPSRSGDFMVPTAKIPEVGVAYVRGVRNVKYYETIFELLAKQFELAKIDEAKNSPVVQVLDKAIPAERKSKPRRVLITLGGILVGAVIGFGAALSKEIYKASRNNPRSNERWQRLSAAFGTRARRRAN
jgi:tyrosine-protein kinase Etk/Wzc